MRDTHAPPQKGLIDLRANIISVMPTKLGLVFFFFFSPPVGSSTVLSIGCAPTRLCWGVVPILTGRKKIQIRALQGGGQEKKN